MEKVKQGMAGTWKGGEQTFDGIGAGMVIIGDLNDKIPASVKKEAMAIRDGIAAGTLHSFTGQSISKTVRSRLLEQLMSEHSLE